MQITLNFSSHDFIIYRYTAYASSGAWESASVTHDTADPIFTRLALPHRWPSSVRVYGSWDSAPVTMCRHNRMNENAK